MDSWSRSFPYVLSQQFKKKVLKWVEVPNNYRPIYVENSNSEFVSVFLFVLMYNTCFMFQSGLLGVFQKMIASRANDHEGFYLMQSLIEHCPK